MPTYNSEAIITSGDIYNWAINSVEISGGDSQYNIKKDVKYTFQNTGSVSVGIYYKVNSSSSYVRIGNSDLGVGNKLEWTAPENADILSISNIEGAKILVCDSSSIFNMAKESYNKLYENETVNVFVGGSNNFDIIAGTKYIFKNTGTANVGIYYKVNSSSSEEFRIGTKDLRVGNSYEWIAPENASVIIISNVEGAQITVTKLVCGSITKRIEDLESSNVVSLRVATFNTGDYTGKDFSQGSEEGKLAYRSLLGEVNAKIIGT